MYGEVGGVGELSPTLLSGRHVHSMRINEQGEKIAIILSTTRQCGMNSLVLWLQDLS